jgi:hypothetical protein
MRLLVYASAGGDTGRSVTHDAADYVTLAYDLRAAYFDPHSPMFAMGLFRTPLYPLFLAPLLIPSEGDLGLAVAAQIVLGVLTVWLTILLATHLVGTRGALTAGALLAIDPVSAFFPSLIQPETLFGVFLVAGSATWVAAVVRGSPRTAFAAGLIFGLAALVRPIGLFLPIVMALTVLLKREAGRRALVGFAFMLGAALPIGGWITKNLALTGSPVFSIVGDSSLLEYRAAAALADDEGIPIEQARDRIWKRFWATATPGMSVVDLSARQRALALEILSEHKLAALRVSGEGLLRLLAGSGLSDLSGLSVTKADGDPRAASGMWSLAAFGIRVTLVLVYLGLLRAIVLMALHGRVFELVLLLGVIGYLVVLSAGPEAHTRFRFPAMPFVAILAGHGLSWRRAA